MPTSSSAHDRLQLTYIPALDGLRAIAVLLVILYHLRGSLAGTPVAALANCGWAGVDLFFVLSGFLITRILLAQRGQPRYFRRFYKRRALRIWPLYFGLVAVAIAYEAAHGAFRSVPWWTYLTLTQNLVVAGFGISMLRMTWSLAIEEQFYLAWPVLIRFVSRRWASLTGLAILLAEPAVRFIAARNYSLVAIYKGTPTHLDGIMMGSLLALWVTTPAFRRRPGIALLAAALIAGLIGTVVCIQPIDAESQTSVFLYSWLALLCAGLVGLCVLDALPGRSVLTFRPLCYIGTISYGLYLLHIQAFGVVGAAGSHWHVSGPLLVPVKIAAAVAIASVSWHFLESPILKRGRPVQSPAPLEPAVV
ncbi:MAG TPA: acyltransferase [Acidobacteriaceae bacterium]|nr:acyltransferase [Acidobacteriaceae bacterium]